MVENIDRARYCPYCGVVLPKIQERPSLEDCPYEQCKSCREVFVALKVKDILSILSSHLPLE